MASKSDNPRIREWFITINKNAECYDGVLERVREMKSTTYALIKHDKDEELVENIDAQTGEKTEVWRTKEEHYHLCLELKNGCTFTALQKRLPGAHIEEMKTKANAYQYLLHESPLSKGVKYNYPFEEIITNNADEVKRLITLTSTREVFNEEDALKYILEGVTTFYAFYKRFGLEQGKKWWNIYFRLVMEFKQYRPKEMLDDMETLALTMKSEEEF